MGQRRALCRELGAELQKRREAAGLTNAELAERVGWTKTKISRMETGQNLPDTIEVIQYLGRCGIFYPHGQDMLELCREASRARGFWLSSPGEWLEDSLSSLIYHEATSDRFLSYAPLLVPGLLQTADYARSRISADKPGEEYVEYSVGIRMDRQRILCAPHPASAVFFIHEQALRLQVGSAAIMHEQMLKIVLMAALSQVTVRVLPCSAGGRSVVGGPFSLFGFAECAPLVYLDHPRSGLFLEDAAYVGPYRDLVPDLDAVALDEPASRALIAELAEEYDQEKTRREG